MDARSVAQRIVDNVESVIVGKRPQVELAVMALLCGGHLLIEDVPGVGKTMLARSLARSSGCSFSRIQFTPDLLPTDVTGVSVYNQQTAKFEFRPGPGPLAGGAGGRDQPRDAQDAVGAAGGDGGAAGDGGRDSHKTPAPFMVMATQNPIEYEGTFPLPEAQLDRFLIRLELGYPSIQDERAIMERQRDGHPVGELALVCRARGSP